MKSYRKNRKALLRSMRGTALDAIKEIKPRLHKIVLSGRAAYIKYYTWECLNQAFEGSLHLVGDYLPSKREPNYGAMCNINRPEFLIQLFLKPLKRNIPPNRIKIYPRGDVPLNRYKDFLVWLYEAIPGLEPSEVEYAIDQFCDSPLDADHVFWVEKYSLYVPNQRFNCRVVQHGHLL